MVAHRSLQVVHGKARDLWQGPTEVSFPNSGPCNLSNFKELLPQDSIFYKRIVPVPYFFSRTPLRLRPYTLLLTPTRTQVHYGKESLALDNSPSEGSKEVSLWLGVTGE